MKNVLLSFSVLLLSIASQAQKPDINYSMPPVLSTGVEISPLTPVNTGGEVVASGVVVSTVAGNTSYGFVNGISTSARFYYPTGVAVDKSGNIFVTDKYNHVIRKITPEGVVSTFAGSGSIGSADGQGTSASFYYPGAVVIDANENLYISDQLNMKIRKITKTGLVTTYAGDGFEDSDDGPAATASFRRPEGLALDSEGNLYVAEFWGHKIRVVSPTGVVSTLAGNGTEASIDGQGSAASFNWPCSICIDAAGTLYVADQAGHKIRKVTKAGLVTTLAGTGAVGSADGPVASATFNSPSGVIVNASGTIFVADRSNNKIRMITPEGVVSTYAGTGTAGSADGAFNTSSFNFPFAFAFDLSEDLIVADRYNHEIRKIVNSLYSVSPALPKGLQMDPKTGIISGTPLYGQLQTNYSIIAKNASGIDTTTLSLTIIGPPVVVTNEATTVTGNSAVGSGSITNLGNPYPTTFGLCWNLTGSPTLVDHVLKKDTVAPTGTFSFKMVDLNPSTTYYVRAFATNANGTAYGSEVHFTTLGMRPDIAYQNPAPLAIGQSITPILPTNSGGLVQNNMGVVSTLSGTTSSGFVNGPVATARFNNPASVAVDKAGTIFVADKYNHVIRKITPEGVVSTFAGSGSIGTSDGQGTAASFYYPAEVAVDANDNVYVTDQYNNRIRKITKTGLVSTVAGNGNQGSADGPATTASFYYPEGIVVDTSGIIYVSDLYNHKIRKITPAGVVSTLAGGSYSGSTDGTGSSASFYYPSGLCLDATGSVLVADQWNNKIRRVTPAGVVTTFAGTGNATSVDGATATATFNYPSGIVKDALGNFYVSERYGNRIRKISTNLQVTTVAGGASSGAVDGAYDVARFNNPFGIALDLSENILIADRNNHEIRKITLTGYSINPALPADLTFDYKTGAISGTPQVSLPTTSYRIIARNEFGIDTATISLTVQGKANVSTIDVTAISDITAFAKGTLINVGVPVATTYGFCWNTTGNPTLSDHVMKKDTSAIAGVFQFNLKDLTPLTTYYLKAFATNSLGTSYGTEISFTTTEMKPKISYISPQTLTQGVAITPLTLTNTGGAVKNSVPIVSTLSGTTSAGFANGTIATATFNNPAAVAVAKNGTIYVADKYNHAIRKISLSGEVSTLAGSGSIGSSDGQGVAASFYYPSAVAVDANENVYVSDQYNNKIRKISITGLVTTLAGSSWVGSSDGQGTAASFYYPEGLVVDTTGTVYVADFYNHRIRKITATGLVTTLAGSGALGSTDGTGTAATFNYPCGITLDAMGNVYVADQRSNKIRKITAAGVVTTIAGSGAAASADGTALAASMNYPSGLARDAVGNLYVSERFGHRIRKLSTDGLLSTVAGNDTVGSTDGMLTTAKFNCPFGIALDLDGNVLVADRFNHKIRKITMSGYTISPSLPAGLQFDYQTGTISGTPLSGSVTKTYTISASNSAGYGTTELSITVQGKSSVSTEAIGSTTFFTAVLNGSLLDLGVPTTTSYGFCWNKIGAPTILDSVSTMTSSAVVGPYTLTLRNLMPGDTYFVRAFSTNAFGTAYGAERSFTTPLNAPNLAYPGPQAYVVGTPITPLTPVNLGGKPASFPYVYTYAGSNESEIVNGAALTAGIYGPAGVALDMDGNMYVTQPGRNIIRKITKEGIVSTFAGDANGYSGSTNGVGTAASFFEPTGIAVDNKGNLYVSDVVNQKIRKITKQGLVTTLAGSGTVGRTNGKGADAHFNNPTGLAVDTAGNVYVADRGNKRICKITPDGMVTTLAVNEPVSNSDDVGGTFADFSEPTGIAIDSTGRILIADYARNVIYKYLPNGSISIFAGSGNSGQANGVGTAASFSRPITIALDSKGNAYVSEYSRIRKITTDGVVTTVVGNTNSSGYLDGKISSALFSSIFGIVFDKNDVFYVADYGNNRIRKIGTANFTISPTLPLGLEFDYITGAISGTPKVVNRQVTFTITSNNAGGTNNATVDIATISKPDALDNMSETRLSILPNPASSQICVKGLMESQVLTIYSLAGIKMHSQEVSNGTIVDVSNLSSGMYLVRVGGKELKLVKN